MPVNGSEVNVSIGTGCSLSLVDLLIFSNQVEKQYQKNADQGIYCHESGSATYYRGIVVETGYSDTSKKARRDNCLWLDNSEMNVSHP